MESKKNKNQAVPTEGGDQETKVAATPRRWEWAGGFCVHLVVFAQPRETITPISMTDDDVDAFLERHPECAHLWKKI